MKEIPQAVKKEAQWRVEQFKCPIEYLGTKNGQEYYTCKMPENSMCGFPDVYIYENETCFTVTGFDALNIIDLFVE